MNSKKTILVVDDEAFNTKILGVILSDDYRVVPAMSGKQALEIARESIPDMILLDILMPEMDGYEVCRQLKADPATRDIPVIFITAMNTEEEEAFGFSLGAVDYITKPVSRPIVKARVNAQLQLGLARRILKKQTEVLEERVREHTREIVRIHKQKERGMRLLADAVAHQLRNPMHTIGGFANLLRTKVPSEVGVDHFLEAIVDSCVRLEDIVTAIRCYNDLSLGETSVRDVAQVALLAVERAMERHPVADGGDDWNVQLQPAVMKTDPALLAKALDEILENALQSMDGGGRVEVVGDFQVNQPGGDIDTIIGVRRFYRLSIRDNGPGISSENLPHATDPFFTTRPQAVGMGLTNVARIAQEMGAHLSILSPPPGKDRGVEVRMSLPVS